MAETKWDRANAVIYNIINGNITDAKRLLKKQSRRQRYITISCMQSDSAISESKLWEWIRIAIEGNFD